VAHITRQTLGFYRESNTLAEIEIRTIIEPILRLYSNKVKSKEIQLDFSADNCPPVWGVAGELKQVIANLIANAIDAVPNKGKIAIRCRESKTNHGRAAEVLIEDDGPGIAPELMDRIFDPFFTTKQDVGTVWVCGLRRRSWAAMEAESMSVNRGRSMAEGRRFRPTSAMRRGLTKHGVRPSIHN